MRPARFTRYTALSGRLRRAAYMPPLQANPLYSFWYMVAGGGGRFTDCHCRGRRPRRPAEVGGDGRCAGGMNPSPTGYLLAEVGRKAAEGSRPLPTMQKINGRQWQGCGPGMPGPYGLTQTGCGREGRGRAAARPFAVGGGCPLTGCRGRLRAAYMPPLQSTR